MPHYYFDTDDGDFRHRDQSGQDLPDLKAARFLAIATLPTMAAEKMPDGDRRFFVVRVRDEAGMVVYTATLDFVGEWQITPPT